MDSRTKEAILMATEALSILEERGMLYEKQGFDSNTHAKILHTLYPTGPGLEIESVIRYRYISYITDKICRYVINGRKDNLLDLANYAFLLAAYDKMFSGTEK